MALAGLKRREWPFAGPIAIRERNWSGTEDIRVFDQWRLEGQPFDADIYRILAGFLERPVPGAELLTLPGRGSSAAAAGDGE
jgi:hypothetical protein